MIRKDVGIKILFDDKDYSPEECSYLYGRFFHVLSNLAKKEVPESFIQKVFPHELFKKERQADVRTSENNHHIYINSDFN